ncbi:MAG TPA: hypothetical protein VHX61_04000 [Rhizomicrobium sp.]|jgi:hypothetical protein|nr:hypothetical protein [Rhizomicrobium sp.]
MILPRKKSRSEIEREFDELREAHDRSIQEWIRARFGESPDLSQNPSPACSAQNSVSEDCDGG